MKSFKDALKGLGDLAQSNSTIKGGLDQIKKTVDDGMKSAKNQWDGFNESSQEKYTEAINHAFDMIPMLQELGYETKEFLIHISVPPSIEIHLDANNTLTKEQVEAVKEKFKENIVFVKVVESLYRAGQLQKKLQSGTLQAKGIHIQLGIPPRVSLVYAPGQPNTEITKLWDNERI